MKEKMKKIVKKLKKLFKKEKDMLVCDLAFMPKNFTLEDWEYWARKRRIIVKDSSRHNNKYKN